MKKWDLWNGSLLAVLGLLVIIFPEFWLKVVVILMGMGAIVYGIYNFKITKALSDSAVYNRTILIRGFVSIIIGICAILFPLVLSSTVWAVMVWVLVGYLIISAALGFYAAALLRNTGINRKKYILENIALLLIAVVLILISPRTLGNAIIRIIGVVTLIVGIVLIVFGIVFKKKSEADETVVTYEVKDDVAEKVSPEEDSEEKSEDNVDVKPDNE